MQILLDILYLILTKIVFYWLTYNINVILTKTFRGDTLTTGRDTCQWCQWRQWWGGCSSNCAGTSLCQWEPRTGAGRCRQWSWCWEPRTDAWLRSWLTAAEQVGLATSRWEETELTGTSVGSSTGKLAILAARGILAWRGPSMRRAIRTKTEGRSRRTQGGGG